MTKQAERTKAILRIAALGAVSAAILALLKVLGILNLRLFGEAFAPGNGAIWLIAASLIAMTAVALVRYGLILRLVSFKAGPAQIIASGLISQAIGQWTPGSMAITEIIRFGLMAGLGEGAKGRLGLSILIDRLLGLGTMFLIGGFAALYLQISGGLLIKHPALVLSLVILSLVIGIGLILSPLLAKTFFWRKFSRALAKTPDQAISSGLPAPLPTKSLLVRIMRRLSRAVELLNGADIRPRRLVLPLALSLLIPFLNASTLYFASRAIGHPLPPLVILAAVPFTILAIFLPLGLAGYGGPQLMAAATFGLFHVRTETVVAACLVQNTVVLAVTTLLGGLSAGFALEQLRGILAGRKNRLSGRRSP